MAVARPLRIRTVRHAPDSRCKCPCGAGIPRPVRRGVYDPKKGARTWLPDILPPCAGPPEFIGLQQFGDLIVAERLAGVSAWISLRIMARMAVDEHSPPSLVPTWLEKKYFRS